MKMLQDAKDDIFKSVKNENDADISCFFYERYRICEAFNTNRGFFENRLKNMHVKMMVYMIF